MLEGPLPREIRIRAVLKRQDHMRQSVQRHRSHHLHLLDAIHLALDGQRHQPLHLFGGVTGPRGGDGHQRRRQIRIRVHGQPLDRPDADSDQCERKHGHQKSLVERGADDAIGQ
jgi:hypothetical protein